MIDDLLEKKGLKLEDLNPTEKEYFFSMLDSLRKTELTPDKLKEYIHSMRDAVEKELSEEPEYIQVFIFRFRNDKNILLKARLRNYMLFESFLLSPEKAKEALDRALAGVIKKV